MTSTDMGILACLALIVLGFTVAALIIRADERDWRRQDPVPRTRRRALPRVPDPRPGRTHRARRNPGRAGREGA